MFGCITMVLGAAIVGSSMWLAVSTHCYGQGPFGLDAKVGPQLEFLI